MVYSVSIIQRSFSTRLEWDEIAAKVSSKLGLDDIVMEKKGTFQCCLVFPSHAEDRDVKEAIQAILRDCTPEQGDAAKPQCIVTVSELSEKEYRSLNEATEEKLKNKGWFSLAVPEEEPKRSQPAKQRVLDEEGRQKSRPVPVPPQKKERQDGEKGLAEVARDLEAMRETLLKRVRGQRHAVYELTQGMFESELFSRYDTARKGPVSTFLFMGPSGVGKTFLAKCFGELSDRPVLVVDMSEYSDNLANLKFNGDHGQSAVVTGFVRKNPNAILIFDEIEKAHINTIHLFLQILDAGQLMDQQLNKEVSFRDTTIIMTTNVGSELYDNVEFRNLSNIPRSALINALNSEKKKGYGEEETVFPQSITTRMANGHIIMFNHLEPYALLEIVRDELALQIDLFRQATGITVEFDEVNLPALIMYAGGGAADARTLRGLARNTVIKEIQDAVMQANETPDRDLTALKKLYLTVSIPDDAEDIYKLFHQTQGMQAVVLSADAAELETVNAPYLNFHITDDAAAFQKRLRGVTDFVLLDPYTGYVIGDRMPADVEDIRSPGMEMFEYLLEYYPEIPIYILDTGKHGQINFGTLLSRGARGVLTLGGELQELTDLLHEYSLNALIGNSVYQLGRAGKYLSYNCAQYPMDEQSVEICFAGLRLKTAVNGEDYGSVTQKGENSSVTFDDIVGCDSAKEALKEFCAVLDDPRKGLLSGKRMPKGVLLYGPPGTGKTMLAKAMANHSNAMFLPISATAFFGSLVGQTEGNIRDLFRKARKYAPSVIFIDEVDAIARRRTGSVSTSHNEDALNTLLAEMDGFTVDEKRPVFILAATNYDIEGDGNRVLDPAFVRRFDRKLKIPLPDTDARQELFRRCLERHSISFGAAHDEALRNMAERSGGMCNADIEMVVEMFSRTLEDRTPTGAAFMDALDEYRFGDIKKHDEVSLRQTAYHEAGHALVSWVCGVKPLFMTIISRNNYGGYLETSGEEKGTYTFSELKDIVCRCLAGRAAELEVYGEVNGINTGASSDIKKARYLVRACLSEYGMGDTLFRYRMGDEGEKLMQEQYARARSIVAVNRAVLDELVELLLKEKCLDKAAIDSFFTGRVKPSQGS